MTEFYIPSTLQNLHDSWLQACIEIQLGLTDDSIPTVQQLEEMDRVWTEIESNDTFDFTSDWIVDEY
jgi:hypothetical protein